MTSTTFQFIKVEQLAVYHLLPDLIICEDFGWLSSGSEPVSMEAPFWYIHTMSRALVTIRIFRVVISTDLITTLGGIACYILLLPACKVEMRVKKRLFLQAGDDFRMSVPPAWSAWVGITGSRSYLLQICSLQINVVGPICIIIWTLRNSFSFSIN